MNIYEKIARARNAFAELNVKKEGKNTYAGYTYFTLDDILPAVNTIAEDLKFVTIFDTTADNAYLTIVDCEKPTDKVVFNCAYVRTITKKVMNDGTEVTDSQGASLKGCHPVQNEGATITYLKRYLYLNAFEISEGDAFDATMNPNECTTKPKKKSFVEVISEFPKGKVNIALGTFGYERVEDIPKDKQAQFYNRLKDI